MADDDIDIYGDDFEYDTAGVGDDLNGEYDMEPEAKPVDTPGQKITSHTTPAQETVGTKRQRDDSSEPDARQNNNNTGNGRGPSLSNLPAKPDDVRRISCLSLCIPLSCRLWLDHSSPCRVAGHPPKPLNVALYALQLHVMCPPCIPAAVSPLLLSIAACRLPLSSFPLLSHTGVSVLSMSITGCRNRYVRAMEWSLRRRRFRTLSNNCSRRTCMVPMRFISVI